MVKGQGHIETFFDIPILRQSLMQQVMLGFAVALQLNFTMTHVLKMPYD